MALRERERFLKLGDGCVEDCCPGEVGWLGCNETEEGAVLEMTTDPEKTLEAIKQWVRGNEDWHDFEIESREGEYVLRENGRPIPFDKVMEIVSKFR